MTHDVFPQASLFVGTYAEAGGRGIYPLLLAADRCEVGRPFDDAANVSFGVHSPRRGIHYLLGEQEDGALGAYRREGGAWRCLATVPTCGAQPCHAALSPDEGWLAVANYGSGSIALFALDAASGLPAGPPVLRTNAGRGPNAERQEAPHAHCVAFSRDGRWLYQTDLGTDEVLAFSIAPGSGTPGPRTCAYAASPGSGPRHLVFHPSAPFAVLACELASTLTVLSVGDGTLAALQILSTLPPDFGGDSLAGHLAFNSHGDRLYVSNRGHDSIAVYAFERGTLRLLGHAPAGGASPRHFLLLEDADTMLVANEQAGSVGRLQVQDDGTLTLRGTAAIPGAAFIFAAPEATETEENRDG